MNLDIASQLSSPLPVWLACQRWFVQPPTEAHVDPGFDSRDPAVIAEDVAVAKALGFAGFVPDHYSLNEPSHDAQMLLLKECENAGLGFMLMQEIKFFQSKLADLNNVMNWCRGNVFGSLAYPRIDGKIPVFEFDWKDNGVDPQIYQAANPDLLIITRNTSQHSYGWPDAFTTATGRPAWQDYVKWYASTFPESFLPCFWQFDDHLAPWHPSPSRLILSRSGQTLQFCIDRINEVLATGHKPLGVLLATHDDYDEGTAARELMRTQYFGMQSVTTEGFTDRD